MEKFAKLYLGVFKWFMRGLALGAIVTVLVVATIDLWGVNPFLAIGGLTITVLGIGAVWADWYLNFKCRE